MAQKLKMTKLNFTDSGDYIPTPGSIEFKKGDFVIEGWIRTELEKSVPNDGEWHNITVSRTGKTTSINCDEKVDGVLFFVHKIFDKDGKLCEMHYTRADLVKF